MYRRTWLRRAMVALLLLVGLNGVAAGFGFVLAPDGSSLGIPQDWLQASPFADYRVPGLLLFGVGLLCLHAALRQLRRASDGWFWSALSGAALVTWIIAQALMMGSFRHPVQTVLQATVLVVGLVLLVFAFMQFRGWTFAWGATPEEAAAAMIGDEIVPRAPFSPTRAVTIAAAPQEVWKWIMQMGYGRAGFYSYDLLDNRGRPSLDRIEPRLQDVAVGDWVPMSSKVSETTAFRVASIEAPHRLLWRKPDSTWAWHLEELPGGTTRLVTRVRQAYDWRSPLLPLTWLLMELGDPFMMRRCLLGIKRRAEASRA